MAKKEGEGSCQWTDTAPAGWLQPTCANKELIITPFYNKILV